MVTKRLKLPKEKCSIEELREIWPLLNRADRLARSKIFSLASIRPTRPR